MTKVARILTVCTVLAAAACGGGEQKQKPAADTSDTALKKTLAGYVVEFLRRNPTTNTYLGGAGLDPSLRQVDGMLRDHSAAAIEQEDRWLPGVSQSLEAIAPSSLTTAARIDREVALAQIKFLLHQHQVRRYHERALDTYASEPFRALDWQMQGMTQTSEKTYGTTDEWQL